MFCSIDAAPSAAHPLLIYAIALSIIVTVADASEAKVSGAEVRGLIRSAHRESVSILPMNTEI